jgi:multiple sugar transport system ATP-binding protein
MDFQRQFRRLGQGLKGRERRGMANVSLIDIEKRFGAHVVIPQLNLEIADGSFVVLVGPSGCGKTTTLNMIAGLETISGGQLLIGGRDVTDVPPKARDIAMVFQSYALFPHMTVFENIAFGMRIRRQAKSEIDLQVRGVANRLRIDALLDRLPKALSGGQRQRVALARALVRRPGVFLMDEPLSNLDAKLRIEARSFLTKMHQEIGVTTVYVTHDQSEAMTMGDTVVVMKDGIIQQAASPLEVYNKPANTFVAGFIGSPAMNFLELTIDGSKLIDKENGFAIVIPDRLRGALSGYQKANVMLGLRPEALRPVPRSMDSHDAPLLSIDVLQHLGHETLLDASSGPHRIVARVSASDDSRIGEKRPFLFDAEHMHLFDPETGANLSVRPG